MIVVDTSVWVDFFRGRDEELGRHLEELLDADRVGIAAPIRLEILGGARKAEFARLRRVLGALPLLLPSSSTWELIERWLERAASTGQHFGIGDLLIAGIAAENDAAVWSLDSDFERMARLGWLHVHRVRAR